MAFPASPSNNDVHKEGNRAFSWDSTLGVWDQVSQAKSLVSAGKMRLVYGANDIPMVKGSTGLTNTLNSGAGVTPTFSSTNSKAIVAVTGSVAKNHSSTSYEHSILLSGGSLGPGILASNETLTKRENTMIAKTITVAGPTGRPYYWSGVGYDSNTGSITPTYHMIRCGTPTIEYEYFHVNMLIFEVF